MPLFNPEQPGRNLRRQPGEGSPAAGKMPGSGGKYVDDYVVAEETDQTDRRKTRVRYAASWYCVTTDPERAKRILYAVLILGAAAAGAVLASLMISHSSSRSGWVGVTQAAAVIPLLTLILGLFRLPFRLRPMERKQYYEGIIRVDRSALGILILSAATIGGEIVFRVRGGELLCPWGDVLFPALFAGAIVACAVILFLLSRLEIEERPNEYHERYYQ